MYNPLYYRALLLPVAILMLLTGCKREDILMQGGSAAPAPLPVSSIKIQNLPGGAKITYTIPKDPNLLYVKATYELKPGEVSETKSSLYVDTLVVAGFGDSLVHKVSLYSVGKNEKMSTPTEIEVHPLVPPVNSVFKTLDLKATFSGALVSFKNPSEAALAMVLLSDSTGNGDWVTADTYYTGAAEGVFSVRGFAPVDRKFAVYVRDRWGNRSDTLARTLTPLFEQLIDKSRFAEVDLPTDDYIGHTWSGLPLREMSFLWNGIWNNGNDCFHTKTSDQRMPQWFTFDMGGKYTLSRFKFYHRAGSDGRYVGGDPQNFEIYGSNNPDPDGGWNNWQLLGSFTSVKPTSGSTVTTEDEQFAVINGEDFEFPLGIPPVRYLRWKTTKTWGGFQYVYISELTFWGTTE